jgi:hypothetical protein
MYNLTLETHDWHRVRDTPINDMDRGFVVQICYTCNKTFANEEEHIAFAMNRLENG